MAWIWIALSGLTVLGVILGWFLLIPTESASFSMRAYARDAKGNPLSVPVEVSDYVLSTMRGSVTSRWDNRWSASEADLVPEVRPWSPTPAAGGTPIGAQTSSSRGWIFQIAPWSVSSGRLFVPMRLERARTRTHGSAARAATEEIWIEVGLPGALLQPKRISVSTNHHRRSVEFIVHFYFE